ncbi:uncharacterized protein PV09_08790 [Verruconis gallopava]|uniref:DUF7702 domain-containing protein n=1 Tax=Verruconis gallopava TaxID=253628 RepID=A0A0D1XBP0_9PEZI|nr:uncharacterized protein PV09_08790 [Verruconis gallopava]KIV99615.1 hypothetical protein PV09_08790 [Verruconis gallopava]
MEPQKKSGPYLPQTWSLGGRLEKHVDIPITAVFLALFIGGAAYHMSIFQINRRRNHRFFFSALIFGFCMARIVTCIMRIASASLPTDLSLAIAAQIFTAAGVVILFIVNLVFAQRLIRSSHPRVGWHPFVGALFKFVYALIVLTIIMVIIVVVQSFYTLSTHTHKIDRDILLYGVTTFAIISFLPIPLTLAATVIPRSNDRPLDKFGKGRWRYKVSILFVGTILVCFGASYRAGTTWLTPVPQTRPLPKILGKAPFYIVNFTIEVLTVYLYAISRVDKRFHIPDGAKQHKNYQKAAAAATSKQRVASDEVEPASEPRTSISKTAGSSDAGSLQNHASDPKSRDVDIEKYAAGEANP